MFNSYVNLPEDISIVPGKDCILATMPRGSVLLYPSATVHGASANQTESVRDVCLFAYSPASQLNMGGFHSHGGIPIAGWFIMENLAAETHTCWFVSTQSHCFLFSFILYIYIYIYIYATSWYHHQLYSLYLLVYNYPTLQIYHNIYIYVS